MNAYVLYIELIAIGLSGALSNYLVNYFKQRISCDFFSYLGGAFGNTLASFGLINGAALSLLQSGTANLDNPDVMAAMFATGYMLDNLVNKETKS